MNNVKYLPIIFLISSISLFSEAFEYDIHGLIEISYSSNDQVNSQDNSFLNAGYGKFSYKNSTSLSLSQAAININFDWGNNITSHLVSNSSYGGLKNSIGITEAYLKYKSIPNESGLRYQLRSGLIYPKISMENTAVAWSNPHSLTSSLINSWIGEEVRHLGTEFKLTKLGKFVQSKHDFSSSLTLFNNNDTTGSLLAWHGWTQTNRQTLWHESIALPNAQIRLPGQVLNDQAEASKPFVEVDKNIGIHANASWQWNRQTELIIGRYDNNGKPYLIMKGQYAWHTKFNHIGFRWNVNKQWMITSQYLSGSTLMQSPLRIDAVNNRYKSAYITLSRKANAHRISLRLENFSVFDHDNTLNDDNNESGNAFTLSYVYRFKKHWFLYAETNQIRSERFSRTYHNQAVDLTEKQVTLALRYYF